MSSLYKLLGIKSPFYQNDRTVPQRCNLAFRNTASKGQIWDFNLSALALNLILFPLHFVILNCAGYSSSPLHLQRQSLCFPHTISIFTSPDSTWGMEEITEPCSRNPVRFCHLSSVLPSIPLIDKPSKPLALRSLKSTSFVFLS